MTQTMHRWLPSLLVTAVLAACGGGGSSAPATPATPATPASLTVSGTTAVGAALAGASVAIQCASGSTTVTSNATGTYSATLSGGALPCVLTATSADGNTVLHSAVPGTGTATVTANITPLTELLVAALAQNDPQAFVSSFTSGTTISASDLVAAQTTVLAALSAAGVDTSAVTDAIGGAITAGSGAGYDGVLDALQARLAGAGVTLSEVTTAVATSSGTGATTVAGTITTALAPAASSCPGLKSGPLRVIDFGTGSSERVVVDASALTVTDSGNTVYTMTRNADCDYTVANGSNTRVLVARSGLATLVTGSGLSGEVAVAIPEQSLDVGALAGVFNRIQYGGTTFDTDVGDFGSVTFNAAGQNTASMNCPNGLGSCAPDTSPAPFGHLVVNPQGGFDYIDEPSSAVAARVYAFRTPVGKTMAVVQEPNGTIAVFTPQEALEAPTVGSQTSFWQYSVNPTAGVMAQPDDTVTVTAFDAASGILSRSFASDGHTDTFTVNQPFAGTRNRAVNGCATSGGGAFNCNGVVQVPFGGLTLSVSSVTNRHFINVSVQKP